MTGIKFPKALEPLVKTLGTLDGRDKLIRTCSYALQIIASRFHARGKTKNAEILQRIASEFSLCRLIMRQCGSLITYKSAMDVWNSHEAGKEFVLHVLDCIIVFLYAIYHPLEHVAWLSKHEVIPMNPTNWWTACTASWAIALAFSIIRGTRRLAQIQFEKRRAKQTNDKIGYRTVVAEETREYWSMIGNICDLFNAVNFLPKGFLWSSTMPQWKVGMYGTIASLIQFYRAYLRCQS